MKKSVIPIVRARLQESLVPCLCHPPDIFSNFSDLNGCAVESGYYSLEGAMFGGEQAPVFAFGLYPQFLPNSQRGNISEVDQFEVQPWSCIVGSNQHSHG
jgi:hypothetical protein